MSSLLPIIISRDPRASKTDQLDSIDCKKSIKQHNILANLPSDFNKFPESQKDEELEVPINENHFEVLMDVHQFRPNEIIVKTDKVNEKLFVVVEAKHNDRQDENGFVSRQFVRRYSLPRICDPKKVIATLSSDGVLAVETPIEKEYIKENERTV